MKYHPHNGVLFITFSIEQGLLLLCNPLCELIIKSCLARAQFLYPVKICGFLIQASHVHLLMVVQNPDDVPQFIRYFKTESSHMLNRLLGRRKRTIWCEGYDSPIVLTFLRALLALVYIYSQPAKDNLEESIAKYPGVSSWKMFCKGEHKKSWSRVHRSVFRLLSRDAQNLGGYTKEAERIRATSTGAHDFTLEPNAWLDAFGIVSKEKQDSINKRIIERIAVIEERAKQKRQQAGTSVLGEKRLRNEVFDLIYQSKRSGKKMWCLSEDRSLRRRFICFLKDLFDRARYVRARWAVGDYSEPYPMGLYPPSQPKLVEPLFIW